MSLVDALRVSNCSAGINSKENMLVAAEAYTKAASAVPDIVTGVIIYPVGYGERHAVKEHITAQILVCFAGHYHYSHI